MSNIDIRTMASANGVSLWQIADALGISEPTMTRKMRRELPQCQKKQIFEIIASLSKAKKEEKSQVRDHPDIEKLMRTGETGSGKYPHCPICGSECETLFKDKTGVVFACDECVEKQDAWESEEAFY